MSGVFFRLQATTTSSSMWISAEPSPGRGAGTLTFCVCPIPTTTRRAGVGDVGRDRLRLNEPGILIDRDEDGYLLQVFNQPAQERPRCPVR